MKPAKIAGESARGSSSLVLATAASTVIGAVIVIVIARNEVNYLHRRQYESYLKLDRNPQIYKKYVARVGSATA